MTAAEEVSLFARDYINFRSFRTTVRKRKIREAYEAVTGKRIKITCSTCYVEAIYEILNNIQMTKKGYELKKGVLLQAFGDASKTCTNDTLTDELAEWYLTHYPEKAIYFSRIPVRPKPKPPANVTIIKPKAAPKVEEAPVEDIVEKMLDVVEKPKKTVKKKVVKKTVKDD